MRKTLTSETRRKNQSESLSQLSASSEESYHHLRHRRKLEYQFGGEQPNRCKESKKNRSHHRPRIRSRSHDKFSSTDRSRSPVDNKFNYRRGRSRSGSCIPNHRERRNSPDYAPYKRRCGEELQDDPNSDQTQRQFRPNTGMLAGLIRDQVRTNYRMDQEEVRRADVALHNFDPNVTERARLMTEYLSSRDSHN